MPGDPNTGFEVGETQVFSDGTYWDQYRIGGTSLASPLMAGVLAVADQFAHRSLGFVNPLYYKLLNTPALHDITAPTSPLAQVRTNYTNSIDNTQGKSYLLQTIDVQSTTIHSKRGYDDETGVGTPGGPLFFLGLPIAALFP
jgi:subtilase family serine protease